MKKVVFVQHTLDRMKDRRITEEQVKSTLKCPGIIDCNNEKRKIAQRLIDGSLLRVIYEEEDDSIVVVSAHCTSRVKKYMRKIE